MRTNITSKGEVGVGLRTPHYRHVLENKTPIKWFEVHSENFFFQDKGLALLQQVRKKFPISLHGIGLSLGSSEGLERKHLERLKNLMDVIDPFLLSEHLAWNKANQHFFPDLFPIPYHAQSFSVFKMNLEIAQDFLKRNLMIENPSSYLEYNDSTHSEVEFLVDLCKSTGAKILLDVNNVYVSCWNHQWDPNHYLSSIPKDMVGEIHLAGHSIKKLGNSTQIRIDTHDTIVADEVWNLYSKAIKLFNDCPTLIEWDANIPDFSVLENEALKAVQYANA